MRRFCSHVKPCGERRSREMEKLKDRIGADLSDPPAVVWEIVKSAEPWGEEPTFDLTVPGSHNFVANDIFAHNSIEQDADTVMFLHHETPKNEMTEAPSTTLIVGKQRNGPIGECQLAFLSSYTRFENYYQAPEYGGD